MFWYILDKIILETKNKKNSSNLKRQINKKRTINMYISFLVSTTISCKFIKNCIHWYTLEGTKFR